MPQVSIGLPVYNGENLLAEALESILSQTFHDFELIISDNGSTDATQEICESFAAEDQRIRYHRHEKNRGAAWNYNYAFSVARGELFKWASHDDLCAPTYLERCVKMLDQNPSIVLCYPRTIIIDEHGNFHGRYYDRLELTSPLPCERFKEYLCLAEGRECNAVFGVIRTEVLAKTPLIGNYNASDQVLLAYLALLGEFYEIPEELFFRRDHPGTSLRANPNAADIAVWFDPSNKGKLVMNNFRKGYEYLKCVLFTRLSFTMRLRCLNPIFKWIWWRKALLAQECNLALNQPVFNGRMQFKLTDFRK